MSIKKFVNQYGYLYSCSYFVGGHYVTIHPCMIRRFKEQLINHLSCLGFIEDCHNHRYPLAHLLDCAQHHLYGFEFHRDLAEDLWLNI